jgi:hypothetical protein
MREILASESTRITLRKLWGDIHAVRDRLACAALVLLVLAAVLISPIERAQASDSQRRPEGLRRSFVLPASESSRLSATAWIMREDAVVPVRSEDDDDDDDDEPWSATRQASATDNPSLSPFRSAPARNRAVPGRVPVLQPLRC